MSKVEGNGQINKLMYIDYASMGSNPKEVMDKYMKEMESVSTKMLADMGYKGLEGKDMNKAIEKLFNDMDKKLGDGGIGSIMGDMGKNITASNKILEQMSKMNDWSALTKMNGAQGLGGISNTDDLAASVKQMMSASAMPSWAPQGSAMPAPGSNITDYSGMFEKMTKELSDKNKQLLKGDKPAKDENIAKDAKAAQASGSNPQYEAMVKQAQKMVETGDYSALMGMGQQPKAGSGATTAFSVAQMQMTDYQNAQTVAAQMGGVPQAPAQGGSMSTAFSVAQMQMNSNLNTNIAAMFTTNVPGGPGYNPVAPGSLTIPNAVPSASAQNTNIAAMFTQNAPGGSGYAPVAPGAPAGSAGIAAMFTQNVPGGPGYAPMAPSAPAGSADIAAMFTQNVPGGPGYAPMAPSAPAGSANIAGSFTQNAPGGPGYAPMAPSAPAGSANIAGSFTQNAPGGPGYAPMAPSAPAGSANIAGSFTQNAPGGPGYAPAPPAAPAGSADIAGNFTQNAPGGPGYAPAPPAAPAGSAGIAGNFTQNAPGGPGYAPMAPAAPNGSYDIAASFINPAPGGAHYAAAKPASADGSISEAYANGVAGAQSMMQTGNYAAVYDNSMGSSANLTATYNDFMRSYMASMGMQESSIDSTMNYYFGSFDSSATAMTGYNSNFAASLPNSNNSQVNPSGDSVKDPAKAGLH